MANLNRAFGYIVLGLIAVAVACRSPVTKPNSTVPGSCKVEQPLVQPQKLDILFVIDNSGSMKEEQESVANELLSFVDELKRGGGVSQDFHVGVVTTSVYQFTKQTVNGADYLNLKRYDEQAGRLQAVPNVEADGGLSDERLLLGTDPQFLDKFRRLVQVGTSGSGQETPLEAARLALTGPLSELPLSEGGNGGFLRDRARLLVVVLTDEDDCSEQKRPPVVYVGSDPARDLCRENSNNLTPVSEYHQIFSNLTDGTGAKREVVWATIGPVGISTKQAQWVLEADQGRNVDCPTSYGAGYRHRALSELFDSSLANLDSICKASYRETLINIAGLAVASQTMAVRNVVDPNMLVLDIVRLDGSKTRCTLQNGGISAFDPPAGTEPARITFAGDCKRRIDDQAVEIRLICAG